MKGAYIQMADRFYELHVAGVTRKLPILNVNDKLAIAGFVILGDVELVEKAAAALVKRVPPETEIMVTAETKGIPLVHEKAGGTVIGRMAILAEGDAMNRKDIVTLENLPLFDAQV